MLVLSLAIGFLAIVYAPDVPYSHTPGVLTCTYNITTFPSQWSGVNAQNGELLTGQVSSDFDGQTLTSIGVYLCFSNGGGPPVTPGTLFVTVGVFDSNGNLISSFGTIDVTTMPKSTPSTTMNGQEFTLTGSHTMLSGQIIGITFSSNPANNYQIGTFCGENCTGSEVTNGGIVDCSAINSCFQSAGFAFGGDLAFGGSPPPSPPKPSSQASAFVGLVLILVIIATGYIAYKDPQEADAIIKAGIYFIVVLAIVFVILQAAGL